MHPIRALIGILTDQIGTGIGGEHHQMSLSVMTKTVSGACGLLTYRGGFSSLSDTRVKKSFVL